jgi:hypothetical protein
MMNLMVKRVDVWAAGLNLHGLSAAVIGSKFILYIGLDTAEDAAKAANLLKQA